MENNQKPRIKSIGKIILIVSLIALVLSVLWFALTTMAVAFWLIIISIISAITGFTLLTTKFDK